MYQPSACLDCSELFTRAHKRPDSKEAANVKKDLKNWIAQISYKRKAKKLTKSSCIWYSQKDKDLFGFPFLKHYANQGIAPENRTEEEREELSSAQNSPAPSLHSNGGGIEQDIIQPTILEELEITSPIPSYQIVVPEVEFRASQNVSDQIAEQIRPLQKDVDGKFDTINSRLNSLFSILEGKSKTSQDDGIRTQTRALVEPVNQVRAEASLEQFVEDTSCQDYIGNLSTNNQNLSCSGVQTEGYVCPQELPNYSGDPYHRRQPHGTRDNNCDGHENMQNNSEPSCQSQSVDWQSDLRNFLTSPQLETILGEKETTEENSVEFLDDFDMQSPESEFIPNFRDSEVAPCNEGSENIGWYKTPRLSKVSGEPPYLIWQDIVVPPSDIEIIKHNVGYIFRVLKNSPDILKVLEHAPRFSEVPDKEPAKLQLEMALLRPLHNKGDQALAGWSPLEANKVKMVLSDSNKKILSASQKKKKFDEDNDESEKHESVVLSTKLVSDDPESARILACLQDKPWSKESLKPHNDLFRSWKVASKETIYMEAALRKVLLAQVQATESLNMIQNLLTPDRIAQCSNQVEFATFIADIAASLSSARMLLQKPTEVLSRQFTDYKTKTRKSAVADLPSESLKKEATEADMFSKGLWSSANLERFSSEAERLKGLGLFQEQYKKRPSAFQYPPPKRTFRGGYQGRSHMAQPNFLKPREFHQTQGQGNQLPQDGSRGARSVTSSYRGRGGSVGGPSRGQKTSGQSTRGFTQAKRGYIPSSRGMPSGARGKGPNTRGQKF